MAAKFGRNTLRDAKFVQWEAGARRIEYAGADGVRHTATVLGRLEALEAALTEQHHCLVRIDLVAENEVRAEFYGPGRHKAAMLLAEMHDLRVEDWSVPVLGVQFCRVTRPLPWA